MGFYNQTKENMTLRDKWEYIHNHFTYYTMNSWNRLKSIANKVKIYNLGLNAEQQEKVYDLLDTEDFYDRLNDIINYGDYTINVGFNGRSGGYLVMYERPDSSGRHTYNCAINTYYWDYDNYDSFIQDNIDSYNCYENPTEVEDDFKNEINSDFDDVVEFDNLCDALRDEVIYMCDECRVIEEEYQITKTRKVIEFDN